MHIYLYGSAARGEATPGSDIDLLAAAERPDPRIDAATYSVYRNEQLRDLWCEGNPFAWHLAIESRLLFSDDGTDFVLNLGQPQPYDRWRSDLDKFQDLYTTAVEVLGLRRDTAVFELGTIFLAIRNLAICYSLSIGLPVFCRRAFERLGSESLFLDPRTERTLENARLLSTRGFGGAPTSAEVDDVLFHIPEISDWIGHLSHKEVS